MSALTESLQARLGRFSAMFGQGSGSPLRDFLTWWGQSLAQWLPMRMRQALGLNRGRLLMHLDGDSLQLRLQHGKELRDLGHLPGVATGGMQGVDPLGADPITPLLGSRLADLPRWLVLPAASSLRRRLTLPSAASERLRDVVGFEIERQTPFAVADVAFDARLVNRRAGDGQIEAELIAVPRTVLDPQLEALGPMEKSLAGIDVAASDGLPLGVNLLPPESRRRYADPWRMWNWVLAAVAAAAIVASMYQILENRRNAADDFEKGMKMRAAPARQAMLQRQELTDMIQGQAFLDRTRAERATTVEIINELTRLLPDGTYLEKLAIEQDRLTLIGLSREAPALITQLQGSKLWRSPALAGALQPDPSSGRDRFTLTAELGPAAPTQEKRRANAN